ncbi:MAG: HD-GYP domain-containing protein [Spirochaeta sp.]|nr:HD-GYP domain-containing protein [Spirochaeta sp.]
MEKWKVANLKPGMKFSKPVYFDGDNLFAPENVPLKEKDLKRLGKWGVEEVESEGSLLSEDTPVDDQTASNFFEQPFRSPEQQEIVAQYAGLVSRLKEFHGQVRNGSGASSEISDSIVDGLLSLVAKRKNDILQFVLYGLHGEAGIVENSLNSVVLSSLVGKNLEMPKHKLLHLSTAALLHDIGMLRLPTEISDKKGALTKEELKVVRTHPIHSYKIITRELKYPEEVGLAALQHQERWDGNGYPRALSAGSIIVPARIIAVVDSFEAMVSRRSYRSSMIGYTAMRHILSDNSRRFDPEILKVFIRTMGIYPIGSIVLLNNSCIARVIENNSEAPLKPKIKVMISEKGMEYTEDDGEVIDLFSNRDFFIARAVDPKERAQKAEA